MSRSVCRRAWPAAVVCGAWASTAAGGVRVAVVVDPPDAHRSPPAAVERAEQLLGDDVAVVARPAAELVAVVHWPADAAAADAITVTDPATGERLADRPLPAADGPAGDAVAAAVRASVAKRAVPAGQRHVLCLVSIRNADLVHVADPFCQDVARLLMRRLADSADLSVLDPGQATAPAGVPAAVVNVDLQLSWAGDQVPLLRATALLSDAAGRPVGKPSADVERPQAPALADALATEVAKAVRSAAPAPAVAADAARRSEADRFRREAELCWDHADRPAACRAAEAALALVPDDPTARAAVARGRLGVAAERLFTVVDQGSPATDAPDLFPRDRVTPADVDQSLRLALSGTDLLAPATAALPDAVEAERLARGYLATLATAVYVGKSNLVMAKLPTTPQQRAALDAVRGSFRRYRVGCQPAAAAAVNSRDGFDHYAEFLYQLLGDSLYCYSRDPGEWADDVARLIPPFIDLAHRFDDKPASGPIYRPSRHPLGPTGQARVDPCGKLLYTLSDWWPQGTVGWGRVDWSIGVRPMERPAFTDAHLDRLAVAFRLLAAEKDMAFRKAGLDGLKWAHRGGDEPLFPRPPRPPGAPPEVTLRQPDLLKAAEPPAPPAVAAPLPPAPVPFWKQERHLVEAKPAGQGVQRLFCPVVVGPDVFVVAMVQDKPGADVKAQLWKLDPTGGRGPSVVAEDADPRAYRDFANAAGENPADHVTADWVGTRADVSGDTYVFTCWGSRVVLFPLAGGPARVVTPEDVGCPGLAVEAAALMDDTLFLAMGLGGRDGLLVSRRLDTGRLDTLAASRRKEHLSPFDDSAPMYVSFMVADPARHRVVFHAMGQHWPAGRDGLWAFDLARPRPALGTAGAFRQLVPDAAPPRRDPPDATSPPALAWRSPTVASQWLIAAAGGSYLYDLATDQRSPVPSVMLARDEPDRGRVQTQVYPWPRGPAAVAGDWVTREIDYLIQLHPHADWGRVNARTGAQQLFPTLRHGERGDDPLPAGCWPVYVADAGDGRVLVGDQVGLWTVTPPDDTTLRPDGRPPPPPPAPPTVQPPPVGGQLPWSTGRTLIDLSRPAVTAADAGLDFVAEPHARGDAVYVVALGHTGPAGATQAFARLVRFSAADGTRRDLGSLPVDRPGWPTNAEPARRNQWGILFAGGSVLGDHDLYATVANRLVAMPLDGSPARAVTAAADVRCNGPLCLLDGQVYVVANAAGGQSIVRCDPATGGVTVAVDDPRVGHPSGGSLAPRPPPTRPTSRPSLRNPSDYSAAVRARQAAYLAADRTEIPFLSADPARHRLLYVVQGTKPDPAADGLWAVDPATGRRQRLLPMRLRSMSVSPTPADGFVPVLSGSATAEDGTVLLVTSSGLIGFDPATDAARPICQASSSRQPVLATTAGPTTIPASDNDLLNGRIPLYAPFAVGDGWVWSAYPPLARVSADGRTFQQFPPMRPDAKENRTMSTVQLFDRGRRLLVADHTGCWVLDVNR